MSASLFPLGINYARGRLNSAFRASPIRQALIAFSLEFQVLGQYAQACFVGYAAGDICIERLVQVQHVAAVETDEMTVTIAAAFETYPVAVGSEFRYHT